MSTIRSHGHNCCCETCYPDDVPCPVCERALNSDGECENDDCASNEREPELCGGGCGETLPDCECANIKAEHERDLRKDADHA